MWQKKMAYDANGLHLSPAARTDCICVSATCVASWHGSPRPQAGARLRSVTSGQDGRGRGLLCIGPTCPALHVTT
jgi:hypothetical protein